VPFVYVDIMALEGEQEKELALFEKVVVKMDYVSQEESVMYSYVCHPCRRPAPFTTPL